MDFQTQFCNFVEDTIRSVPEYEDRGVVILEDIREREKISEYKTHFLNNVKENTERITNQDEALFLEDDLVLIRGLSLKDYWGEFSDNTKGTIWKYIQILMLCAHLENAARDLKQGGQENENIPAAGAGEGEEGGGDGGEQTGNPGMSFEGFSDFLEKEMKPDMMKKMIENLKKTAGTTKQNDEFMKDIMGSKIGSLAKEIAESIGTEDLAKSLGIDNMNDAAKQNPMEIFKKFTTKEGSKKMMSMMSRIGNTLQQKMSSGELNPQDLVQEAMGMMGKIGKNPMMKGVQALLQREGRRNAVAQRLRRKYEARQQQLAAEATVEAENAEAGAGAGAGAGEENAPKKKRKGGKRGGRKVKK